MKRAAAYLRVSSAGQRERVTIESQRREVPAWIASQGWTLVDVYEDDGRTAKAGNLDRRDGFARLLADIRPRGIDVVAVVAVDRLTRSEDPVERAQVVASVVKAGAQIAVVGAGIQDTGTFAGDAYLTLQALFAAEDNRRRRQKTIDGHITAAMRGRKPRGWTPYGLTYDAEADGASGWGIDRECSEAVVEIMRRTAAGESSGRIAVDLERRGVPTANGGRWTSERIRTLVKSDVYLGRLMAYEARNLIVSVPTFVCPDLVEEARAVLVARYRRPPSRVVYHHLLTGLARCALCGCSVGVAGTTDRATGKQPTAYRCTGRRYPLPDQPRCTLPLLRTAITDAWVWDAVTDAIGTDTVVDRQWAMLHGGGRPDPDKFRAELDRIDRAQESALDHAARGLISQAIADAQVRRLATSRQVAAESLKLALAADIGIRAVGSKALLAERLADLRAGLEDATPEEKRRWFAALAARVVIGPRSISIDLRIDVPTVMRSQAQVVSASQPAPVTALPLGRIRVLAPRRKAA